LVFLLVLSFYCIVSVCSRWWMFLVLLGVGLLLLLCVLCV